MTATKCRDCDRPITDIAAARRHDGRGPKCWRAHRIEAQMTIPLGDTSRWNDDMTGQQELEGAHDDAR